MKPIRWLVMLSMVLIPVVSTAQPSRVDLPPVTSETGDAEACLPSRWIARTADPEGTCPGLERPGWTVQPLFSDPSAPGPLPPALAPFCLYEHPVGDATTVPGLVAENRLLDAAMDCAVVAPAAPKSPAVLASELHPMLHERFLEQVGRVDPPASRPEVRLALLDSSPTASKSPETVKSNGFHGYSLAVLARDVLCDGADCMARVTSRLVLPIVDYRPARKQVLRDPAGGGYLGTLSELALGVFREVEDWRKAQTERHLVLNLSVAWDGDRFGGGATPPRTLKPPVQAIYRALEIAACRGALTIAATGNSLGARDGTGPLYPAAWGDRPAPSRRACARLLGTRPPRAAVAGPPRPLVVAAGGVDAASQPLANARPDSMPPFVAYGDHASVPSQAGEPELPAHALTGSSVAALVVSTAAAAVWQHRPDLTPGQVLGHLEGGGEDLHRRVDVAMGSGGPRTQHRIGVCGAVTDACARGGGSCPKELPECPSPSADPLVLDAVDLSVFDEPTETELVEAPEMTGELPLRDPCHAAALLYVDGKGTAPDWPCPHEQLPAIQAVPWAGPQPGSNPCPHCGLFPDDGCLMLEIDAAFEGTLENAVIQAGDVAVSLPLPPLQAGDRVHVTGLDPELFGDETPVLVFTIDGKRSVMSPLLVGERFVESE